LGDIVPLFSVYYVMPFPVLLLFVKRKCVHSVDEVAVCCHFVLKRVIGEEIDGGVSGGRLVEDAYVKAVWSSSYTEVKEVDVVFRFHRGAELDAGVDTVDVL